MQKQKPKNPEESKIAQEKILAVVKQESPELLHQLSKNKRDLLLQSIPRISSHLVSLQTSVSYHSGPLPSPETLERYNATIPDGANRIMLDVEKQSKHRQGLERDSLDAQIANQKRGQILAFIALIILVLAGIALAWKGEKEIAETIFKYTIGAVVGSFIVGKVAQHFDLKKKR